MPGLNANIIKYINWERGRGLIQIELVIIISHIWI